MTASILLTATLRPHVRTRLTIQAVEERQSDYRAAIAKWLDIAHSSGSRLIVAENSGAQVEELLGSSRPNPETFVHLAGPAPSRSAVAGGKGASEAELLDWAVAELRMDGDALLFKCTGRLVVRNFGRLLASWRPGGALILDLPRQRPMTWCDSRFFGATAATWKNGLSDMALSIDDEADVVYENVLASRAHEIARRQRGAVLGFPEQPWIVGRSGTSGRTYSSSRVKGALRPAIRLVDRRLRRGRLLL